MREALVAAGMILLGTYYFLKKKTDKRKALICKACATALPGLLLLAACAERGAVSLAAGCTLAAVLSYMAADVLLECRFVAGTAAFSAGHICMAAGFLTELSFHLAEAGAVFALFMAAAFLALRKYFPLLKNKKLYVPAVLYIAVLSIMASLAVCAGTEMAMPAGLIPAAGGVCFVVSDILLGLNRLGKKRSRVRGAFVLILYYASVYLFSMRLWY